MTKEKELGYKLCDVLFHNLEGFQELWNKADYDTKELIINRLGSISNEERIDNTEFLYIKENQQNGEISKLY